MFFIEIERLYLINSEFLDEIYKLDQKTQQLTAELENQSRSMGDQQNLEKVVQGLH